MRGGANSLTVRNYNQSLVLEMIRQGYESRTEIAESTGLSAQTISNIVHRLSDLGLVAEAGRRPPENGGKPRIKLSVIPDAGYALGVQIDRDETSLALVDLTGRVVARVRRQTPKERGPEGTIRQVVHAVERLAGEARLPPEKLLGLGVACPGPLDRRTGVVYEPPGLPGWHEVPLRDRLEKESGYPVIVDNDATAAAVGEKWAGGAQGVRNFAFVYMGVGLGAGLFLQDRLYRGATGNAGEFGHATLDLNGPECFCGNRGCVEVLCAPRAVIAAVERRLGGGEPSLMREGYRSGPEGLDFADVRQAALMGDDLALSELDRSASVLGTALVNLVNTLDVELITLGGEAFRGVGHIYRRKIVEVLDDRILARTRRKVRVELSEAGEDAGAVGAASMVLHSAYAPRMTRLKAV